MRGTSRLLTASFVGVLMLLGSAAGAQNKADEQAGQAAVIHGLVTDDAGAPVAGAMVSAIGAATTFAISDKNGRYELGALAPGSYLVRAHRSGFTASRTVSVDVRAGGRVSSTITLRRTDPQILAAGVGLIGTVETAERAEDAAGPGTSGEPVDNRDDQTETAWRIRHARRGILKDADIARIADDDSTSNPFAAVDVLGRAVGSPARLATSFFADTPFSGQVNLLTTSSFDSPQQLFSGGNLARGTAYARVGAPVGTQGDWTVRGAITQADITAWLVAGSYKTRAPARHQYEFGMSYSMQRYDGGNPLALRDVADGSRNAGMVYAVDTFTVSPSMWVSYGGRYAQYDYLEHRTLVSPRISFTVAPASGFRMSALVSRRAHAPGAEEFLPPGDTGIWLPPQRTFSSLEAGQSLDAERTTLMAFEVERDVAASTIAFRAFRQRTDDQLVTVFGAELPSQPVAKLGHYLIANVGDVAARGYTAEFRTNIVGRVQSSVAYSLATAEMDPASDLRFLLLLAPSATRPARERIHDLATTIEAEVPETSTKVLVLYRLSNGFARDAMAGTEGALRPGLDSRFDVQVRQSLPFLDFSAARWEMLVAVRNFFREASDDQSVYDELLTVRPPKRIVGGVTVHF
jgi:hypothetical protein